MFNYGTLVSQDLEVRNKQIFEVTKFERELPETEIQERLAQKDAEISMAQSFDAETVIQTALDEKAKIEKALSDAS